MSKDRHLAPDDARKSRMSPALVDSSHMCWDAAAFNRLKIAHLFRKDCFEKIRTWRRSLHSSS
jgi:hypothetical protein